jgi:hypothetical protein
LVYLKSFEYHVQILGNVFERVSKFNIKLKSTKSKLFVLHIIWCGRKVFKDGLTEISLQETAKPLPALNWIRSTIPDYVHNVAPAQVPLRVSLVDEDTWMTDHDTTFDCSLITKISSFSSIQLSKSQTSRSGLWISCVMDVKA